MPWYRRCYVPGGTYFFTVVTHGRRRFLTDAPARTLLGQVMREEMAARPFEVVAIVLLPDHLHTVWKLPPGDANYSQRWSSIKEEFTRRYLRGGGTEGAVSSSRAKRRERGVWQRRFWEHTVQDEEDLRGCVDYIHCNPVKHGMAPRARDYPWSSFAQFVESGDYDPDWGSLLSPEIPGAEWEV